MDCNCIHEDICNHRKLILDALEGIIPIQFGGTHSAWIEFEKCVQNHCKHRISKDTIIFKKV